MGLTGTHLSLAQVALKFPRPGKIQGSWKCSGLSRGNLISDLNQSKQVDSLLWFLIQCLRSVSVEKEKDMKVKKSFHRNLQAPHLSHVRVSTFLQIGISRLFSKESSGDKGVSRG